MIRHAMRTLLAQPAVSGGIVLSLALAIGANTTIFGLVDEILWKPLPVQAPNRVVAIYGVRTTDGTFISSSYLDFQDYQDGSASVCSSLAAYVRVPLRLERPSSASTIGAEFVSAQYFEAVGVTPQGRAFTADDERAARPVALVSERLWRQLGANPGGLGAQLVFNGHAVTVIGIVPAVYKGILLDWADPPDVWLPLSAIEQTLPFMRGGGLFTRRDARGLMIVGRLRAGVSHTEASAALRTLAARLETTYPESNRRVTATVLPAQQARFWPARRPTITRTLVMFGGAVGLVLLLACTNIANLLLERASARRKEIAIRLALGATRASLVRQLMTESLLLAIGGALSGLLFARALSTALAAAQQPFGVRLALDLPLDARGLAFTVLLALVSAIFFGLGPALRASRSDLVPALKGTQSTTAGFGLFSLRHVLVIAQVAMSLVLLVSGGLFARSFYESYCQNPGFQSDRLLIVPLDLTARIGAGKNRAVLIEAAERARSLPGVESSAFAQEPPFGPMRVRITLTTETNGKIESEAKDVGAGYLRTVGIPILAGRDIQASDLASGARTAVVNDTLARQLFGSARALGRIVRAVTPTGADDALEIVGIARTAKYHSVWEDPVPMLYRPLRRERIAGATLLIRTHVPLTSAASYASALRELVNRLDPTLSAPIPQTGSDQLGHAAAAQRAAAGLLGMFSLTALALASVGLYSVLAYAVAQRTREIGVRIALGAEPTRVRREIVARGVLLACIGLALGIGATLLLTPSFGALVPGVTTTDPITFGAVSLVLLTVATIASVRPARHASRVDPLKAIRAE